MLNFTSIMASPLLTPGKKERIARKKKGENKSKIGLSLLFANPVKPPKVNYRIYGASEWH